MAHLSSWVILIFLTLTGLLSLDHHTSSVILYLTTTSLNLSPLLLTAKATRWTLLYITNTPDSVSNLTVLSQPAPSLSSDHSSLTFQFASRGVFASNFHSNHPPKSVFDYSKADWDGMLFHLLDLDFNSFYESSDIEFLWYFLTNSLSSVMSLFIPLLTIRSHQRPKWFSPIIQHHLNQIHTLRKRSRSSPSLDIHNKLNLAELQLQEEMTKAKVSYEHQLVTLSTKPTRYSNT